MNTVILFGSPSESGATAKLVSAFCDALPTSARIRAFGAFEQNVRPCIDCGLCADGWRCAYDDMDVILEALLECDLLVIASPIYFLSFPAPLKAILDRTQRCFAAHLQGRSPFASKPRQAAVLLAAGSPSERGEVIRQQLRWLLPPLNAELCGMVVCADTDASGVSSEALGQAAALGASLRKSD